MMLDMEIPITDATTFTASLQNNMFQPFILPALRPGYAISIRTLDTSHPTAAKMPRPQLCAPAIMANGDSAVRIPNAESAPITPKIPKIKANHGVILKIASTALGGKGGIFLKKSSKVVSIWFTDFAAI